MTSKISSIPRRHFLWFLLTLLFGWIASGWIHDPEVVTKQDAWASFASVVASASASMVSLTVAITAVLYALLGTPLIKFLHERGALNRVLFDLMTSALIWIIALMASIISAHPNGFCHDLLMRIATTCVLAGALYFIPIGLAFWHLLKNSAEISEAKPKHDFYRKTELD